MRPVSTLLLASLLIGGCASEPGGPEIAREVVLKYVGDGVGTVGPFNRKDKAELASLSPADRAKASELLDHGALGFLVCRPGDGKPTPVAGGTLADLIAVDRILFVQHGKIAGDFAAVK